MEPEIKTWCPECGPDVPVDEDGCCTKCGSTATGSGADAAHRCIEALDVLADYAIHASLGHVRLAPGVCRACAVEAAAGTEDVPHPIPARFHRCDGRED